MTENALTAQPTKSSLPAGAAPIVKSLETFGPDLDRYRCGPLPKVTTEVKQAARDSLEIIGQRMQPADREGIKASIFVLMNHYYTADLPENVHKAIAYDWLAVLKDYPAWAIEQARIKYLKTSERKPTPAHIVKICDRVLAKDRAMKLQCERILDAPFDEPEQELTEEQMAENREKMKEHMAEIRKNLAG